VGKIRTIRALLPYYYITDVTQRTQRRHRVQGGLSGRNGDLLAKKDFYSFEI
jgi:hypothetical protein